MYILSLATICMDHMYMLSVLIFLFACLVYAAFVCKCMLHCTSMLPQMRFTLNSVQQRYAKSILKRLIKPCNNG